MTLVHTLLDDSTSKFKTNLTIFLTNFKRKQNDAILNLKWIFSSLTFNTIGPFELKTNC